MTGADSTFIWDQLKEWRGLFLDWFSEAVPHDRQQEAKDDPWSYFENHPSEQGQLSSRFRGTYAKIRLFHACRPADVGNYITNGFLPLSIAKAEEEGKAIFLERDPGNKSAEAFSKAVAEMNKHGRDGRLCLVLDDIFLQSEAGHYLIYGSEYLSGIASYLSHETGTDYRKLLLEIGIPTMFVCDVPLCHFSEADIQALLSEIISYVSRSPEATDPAERRIDYTFTFFYPLPPAIIVSHYHPQRIVNKIQGRTYVNSHTRCEFCA